MIKVDIINFIHSFIHPFVQLLYQSHFPRHYGKTKMIETFILPAFTKCVCVCVHFYYLYIFNYANHGDISYKHWQYLWGFFMLIT